MNVFLKLLLSLFIIKLFYEYIYLKIYYYRIIDFLDKYNCNKDLYYLLYDLFKDKEKIIVETSIKNGKDGRYTIPILFKHFKELTIDQKNKIYDFIGFKIEIDIDDYDDIIFGIDTLDKDNEIKKIYFDTDKKIICYQSDKTIKIYEKLDNNTFKIYRNGIFENEYNIRKNIFSNFITIKNNIIQTTYHRFIL